VTLTQNSICVTFLVFPFPNIFNELHCLAAFGIFSALFPDFPLAKMPSCPAVSISFLYVIPVSDPLLQSSPVYGVAKLRSFSKLPKETFIYFPLVPPGLNSLIPSVVITSESPIVPLFPSGFALIT